MRKNEIGGKEGGESREAKVAARLWVTGGRREGLRDADIEKILIYPLLFSTLVLVFPARHSRSGHHGKP
jgi:hypothetical protein